ncbi:hypothetical protein L2E82_27210 [Cichorium intybus]|uniref:Uncharacterized protein n=1 Tax=Cichorium intybus TaxID=13427 RepID=A0ACB9CSC5_CICIN|nr:hypothetical protein L2E82_27210 [Cichorium intybus]
MESKSYEELHGVNNWDGLLDPLDLDLRTLILRYGDLCSATEQAFNKDSKYNGYSHYGKSSFFKGVMLPWADSSYEVISFLYATSRINSKLALLFHGMSNEDSEFESNWMGYIAVSNDQFSKSIGRREICVVWRGTMKNYEYIDDLLYAKQVPIEPLLSPGNDCSTDTPKIMEGWLTVYNTSDPNSEFVKVSARTQFLTRMEELIGKYKDEKVSITCTGHSLGAILAVLSAFDLAENVVKRDVNVSAFVFACPQVGNQAFKEKMQELTNLKVLIVKNEPDIVPLWPSKITKKIDNNSWVPVPSDLRGYVDVGTEILIDNKKSPYLKDESGLSGSSKVIVHHNLQVMLHTLGGWNGKNGDFDWSIAKRDLSLVNMFTGVLKEEFEIPECWWIEKNKGMVLNDDGYWILSPPDPNDHGLPVN